MKLFVAFTIVAALASAAPAAAAPSALVTVRASGDRGWSLTCTFEREGKGPITKSAGRAGRKAGTLAVRDVTGGRCDYRASVSGPLQITFTDATDTGRCPWARIGDQCRTDIEAGGDGHFEF